MHLDLLIGRERPLAWVLRLWPVLAAAVYVLVFGISAAVVWRKGYLKMHGLQGAVPEARNPKQTPRTKTQMTRALVPRG